MINLLFFQLLKTKKKNKSEQKPNWKFVRSLFDDFPPLGNQQDVL